MIFSAALRLREGGLTASGGAEASVRGFGESTSGGVSGASSGGRSAGVDVLGEDRLGCGSGGSGRKGVVCGSSAFFYIVGDECRGGRVWCRVPFPHPRRWVAREIQGAINCRYNSISYLASSSLSARLGLPRHRFPSCS